MRPPALRSGATVSALVCATQKPREHHISKTNEGNFGVKGQGHSKRRHKRRWKPIEFHLVLDKKLASVS